MVDQVLFHINAVRPLGAFRADHPNGVYFFTELPKVFADAREDDGMVFHTHGVRQADGSYLGLDELTSLRTQRTEDNPHILTMASWLDVAALHRFAYREPNHRSGMKQLRDWVDRSEGATMAMWWAPRGTRVNLEEGWSRLQKLRQKGPTKDAFSLQNRFDAPVLD